MNKSKIFIGLAVCAFLAFGCDGHHHDHNHNHDAEDGHNHPEKEAVEEEHHHDDNEVTLSAAQQELIGIATTTVASQPFHGVIAVGGSLISSPTDATTIVAPATGQIAMDKSIVEGMQVNQGNTLFRIDTEALAQTSNATQTKLALDAATNRLQRARQLVAEKLISQREMDELQAEYDAALVAHKATTRQGSDNVSVIAPANGYITGCLVRTGDFVTAGQSLCTLTKGRSILLKAEVPERYFGRLNNIVSAHFKPSYSNDVYDIDTLGGKLMAREATAQQNGGYLTITFSFDNRHALVPGCYAEVWLQTDKSHNAICVPLSALVREGDIFYVFVQDDDTCFEKREVVLGDSNGAECEVKAGLNNGERVVVKGAPQLAIAASARVIPGHTHNH